MNQVVDDHYYQHEERVEDIKKEFMTKEIAISAHSIFNHAEH